MLTCAPLDSTGWAREWSALALAVVAYAGLAFLVAPHVPAPPHLADAFVPELRSLIAPEPVERALFLLGLACIPTLPAAFWLLLPSMQIDARIRDLLLGGGAAIWLTWLSFQSEIPDAPVYFAVAIVIAAALWLARRAAPKPSPVYAAAAMAVVLLCWRTQWIDDRWFLSDFGVWHHFDLLLGAVNGVLHGRTPLVNLDSQYGVLWEDAAALFTRPFGLSVASLSAFFATLGALQLLLLWLALARAMGRNSLATLLAFIAVVGVSHPLFATAQYNLEGSVFRGGAGGFEVFPFYYQWFPIRTFWPAVFFWLVPLSRDRRAMIAGYVLAGLALLWNVDQGLVVLIAWSAHLAYQRRSLRHAALGAFTAAAAIGAYVLFARARAGAWPDLSRLLLFQKVFYGSGFGMLPMKLGELWQPLILVYAVVVFACVRSLFAGAQREDEPWKLFIALYGLGSFAYYQGRSSPKVLIAVMMPAVFLCCLYAREALARRSVAVVLWSLWCGYGAVNFVRALPEAVALSMDRGPDVEFDTRATDALRADIGGRPAVMLADPDAYLLVKSGSWSALPTAGNAEVFLLAQLEEVQRVIDRAGTVVVLHPQLAPIWARHLDLRRLHGARRPGGFVVLRH